MCTWSRQWVVRVRRSEEVMVVWEKGVWSLEARRWRIVDARRGTLKWWRGSNRIMVAEWPLRSVMEGNVVGRMAWAMMR
jgi:hypothetical protein